MSGQAAGESYMSNTNFSQRSRSKISSITCFGVDLTPDNFAVAIVYFVQGVLGLARLAVSFYLKDDLHLDPAEVSHKLFIKYNKCYFLIHVGGSITLCCSHFTCFKYNICCKCLSIP